MKKIKNYISILLCLLFIFCAGCGKENTDTNVKHFEFSKNNDAYGKLIAENGKYRLSLDTETLDFYIENSENGNIWYSSPAADPLYSGDKDSIRSLFNLSAKTETNRETFSLYNNCVLNKSFEITEKKNGFTIKASVGKIHEITSLDLPQAVEKMRFENKIISKLSEAEQKEVLSRYTLYSLSDENLSDRKKQTALEKYPTLEQNDLYIINNGVPSYSAEKIKKFLDSIGYSIDEIKKDNTDNGIEIEVEENLSFDIAMSVLLTKYGFDVEIDCSHLTDKENPVESISILPYFGASYKDDDSGFLLLPDGCGSIIDINGSTAAYPNYSVQLYGSTKTISVSQASSSIENAVLPVFGMSNGDRSFAAIITEGDAISSVSFNLKKAQSASSVYCSIAPNESADVDTGYTDTASGSLINLTQPTSYNGKAKVSYLLNLEGSKLFDMAESVSNFLIDNKLIEKKQSDNRLRLEIIGAIDKKTNILGIFETTKTVAITDFKKAAEIINDLHSSGVKKIDVIYRGWCNGGLYTKALDKISVEKVLGGEKGLSEFKNFLNKNGDSLTLSVELMMVENTKGFKSSSMAARALGNTLSRKLSYDIATGNAFSKRMGTYLAPEKLSAYSSEFFKEIKKLQYDNIQIEDIGKIIYCDMNTDFGNTREDTKKTVKEILRKNKGLTVSSGNLYSVSYADYISGIPLDSSRYKREKYAVPFLQMVLRGNIGYSSASVNMSGNFKEQLLRAVSFGADITFTVGGCDKDTYYNTYFSEYAVTDYGNCAAIIKETIQKTKLLYDKISSYKIIGYEKIAEGVFKTEYENRISVISNYNLHSVSTEYGDISAQDYIIAEEVPE